MGRYTMDDGTVVDTSKAKKHWNEATYFNGSNYISKATNDQWLHEHLYLSAKGRYYLVSWSQWQGSQDTATWLLPTDALHWLLANDYTDDDIPKELQAEIDDIIE